MFYQLNVLEDDAYQLGDGFEDMDANATILMGCFEDPVVTADEVAIGHDVLGWSISKNDRFLLTDRLLGIHLV